VSLSKDSDRKIDIKWTPRSDGNSPIKYFIIQYRAVPRGKHWPGQSMNKAIVNVVATSWDSDRTSRVENIPCIKDLDYINLIVLIKHEKTIKKLPWLEPCFGQIKCTPTGTSSVGGDRLS
jgi:hypothetical protein